MATAPTINDKTKAQNAKYKAGIFKKALFLFSSLKKRKLQPRFPQKAKVINAYEIQNEEVTFERPTVLPDTTNTTTLKTANATAQHIT